MEIIFGIIVLAVIVLFSVNLLQGLHYRFSRAQTFRAACPGLVASRFNVRMKRSDNVDIFEIHSLAKFSGDGGSSSFGPWWNTVVYFDFTDSEPIAIVIQEQYGEIRDRSLKVKIASIVDLELRPYEGITFFNVAFKGQSELVTKRFYISNKAAEDIRFLKRRLNEFMAKAK